MWPELAQEGNYREQSLLPDDPIPVSIDGGYVRAAHKQGFFEVIAGRSVVAFRRGAEDNVPEAKCFGYVQTYDRKPRRRLWELLKSQGWQAISRSSSSPMAVRTCVACRLTCSQAASTGSTGSTSR